MGESSEEKSILAVAYTASIMLASNVLSLLQRAERFRNPHRCSILAIAIHYDNIIIP